MKVAVTGATGLIGRHLLTTLVAEGHEALAIPRRAPAPLSDAVVHLAGEPVAQRWTAESRARIRDSRVEGTRRLVESLSKLPQPPNVLVCASAIGYYGDRGDETLIEQSSPGHDFLAQVCTAWEKEAAAAEALGVRVVRLRIGVVLARDGGALASMLPPFRFGVGGKLASGRQWMSWIHIDDVTGLIAHALNAPISGAMNATAPEPVRNSEFTEVLARVLHRPAIFPVPAFVLRLAFGEMSEILLAGQRVLPKAAEAAGYRFQFTSLQPALADVLLRH